MHRNITCYLIWGIVWLAIVGTGFSLLMNYENTPGKTLSLSQVWPEHSRIQPDKRKPTLVMLVHPQCPCSRASVSELAELIDKFKGQVKVYMLFYKPSGFDANWGKTDLWSSAKRIQGATLVEDINGEEAKRFHANISGQILFYNHRKQLLFNGGITSARGQTGESAGRAALEKLLTKGQPWHLELPVFGCPIISLKPEKV